MSVRESFPNLWQFFGGYFHQDWTHDSSDPDVIIRTFIDDSSSHVLVSVHTELNSLLNQDLSDADLRESLTKLGCYVHYPAIGMTAREWLTHVCARLSELADQKGAGKAT